MRIDKVVAALPATLTPNTVYAVRVGSGFDLHISDSTGTTAYPINSGAGVGAARPSFIKWGGRVYLEATQIWVGMADDVYATQAYNINEPAGGGVDPEIEWEHNGIILPAGTSIKRLHMAGRCNNGSVTEIEFSGNFVRPAVGETFHTGLSSDADIQTQEILRDFWMTPNVGLPHLGPTTHKHTRTIEINYTTPEQGEFAFYYKPSGAADTFPSRYYFNHIAVLEIE